MWFLFLIWIHLKLKLGFGTSNFCEERWTCQKSSQKFSLHVDNGVFPKWSVTFTEFSEFRETDNHWSMNWAQFTDPVSHMCCAGAVVACWPLTQEVAGW